MDIKHRNVIRVLRDYKSEGGHELNDGIGKLFCFLSDEKNEYLFQESG